MRVLVLTHGPEITPGWLEDALREVGAEADMVDLSRGDSLAGRRWDKVVVMGGHMGAYDVDAHSWLRAEKAFIKDQLAAGTPLLGICLGSQLLAEAAGGSAYRSDRTEVGLLSLQHTADGAEDAAVAAIDGAVVVWHHDTFDLPPAAELLARTNDYPHAFRVGSGLGVQFHPEVTPEMWDGWVAAAGTEELESAGLDPDRFAEALRADAGRLRTQAVAFFRTWLEE